MSEELSRAVGEAQATAENAAKRAEVASSNAHRAIDITTEMKLETFKRTAEVDKRLDGIDRDVRDLGDRMGKQEDVMQKYDAAATQLAESVNRLTRKLSPPTWTGEQIRNTWRGAKPKTKATLITLVGLFISPTMIALLKQLGELIDHLSRLFAH